MMDAMIAAVPRFLDDVSRYGGLKGTDIANITDVSKATVSRWKSGDAKPIPANERILSDLHYLVARLHEYYTPDEVRTWLHAPHPQLAGERAIDLLHQNRLVEVLQVIDRLDSGAFL